MTLSNPKSTSRTAQADRTTEVARVRLPSLTIIGSVSGKSARLLATRVLAALEECDTAERKGEIVVSAVSDALAAADIEALPPGFDDALKRSFESLLRRGGATSFSSSGLQLQLRLDEIPATARKSSARAAASTRSAAESVSDPVVDRFKRSVGKELEDLPRDFDVRRSVARELQHATREAIARSIEPVLNDKVRSMPMATYEDKKALAKWVNAELNDLGLALRCPKTGRPAWLLGHASGTPGVGRFHYELSDPREGHRRTVTSTALPHLELMPDRLWRSPGTKGRGR